MFKKILVLFLSFVMTFSLVSCGSSDNKNKDIDNTDKDDKTENDDDNTENKDDKKDEDKESTSFLSNIKLDYNKFDTNGVQPVNPDGSSVIHPIDISHNDGYVKFIFENGTSMNLDETVEGAGFTFHFTRLEQEEGENLKLYMEVTNNDKEACKVYSDVDVAFDGHAATMHAYPKDGENFYLEYGETLEVRLELLIVDVNLDSVNDFNTITGCISTYREDENGEYIVVPFTINLKDTAKVENPYKDVGYELYNENGISVNVVGYNIVHDDPNTGDSLYVIYMLKNDSDDVVEFSSFFDTINDEIYLGLLQVTNIIPNSFALGYTSYPLKLLKIEENDYMKNITFSLSYMLDFYKHTKDSNRTSVEIEPKTVTFGKDFVD